MRYLVILTRSIIVLAILANAPAFTFAMTDGDHISKSEEQETRRIARLFLQRFEQTQDINPILDELFVTDFSDRFLRETSELNYFFDIEPELAPKINPTEFRRFYAVMSNWLYLGGLHMLSNHSLESFESLSEEQVYPPDVWKLLVSNPYLAHIFNEEAEGNIATERTISYLEQLRSITDTVEKANALLRKHVVRSRVGQTRQYRENLKYLFLEALFAKPVRCFQIEKIRRIWPIFLASRFSYQCVKE